MNFLHQIITSTYVYILFVKNKQVFLHVLNLRTEESYSISGDTIILDVLSVDPEVTFDDVVEVHDIIVSTYSK